jgi:TolB-like protein
MKHFIGLFLLISINKLAFAQNSFKTSLNEVSTDIAQKLLNKNKKKIAVLYITDNNKAPTTIGKYMADVISNDIVNHPENFLVFDRDNLTSIVEAKKLIAEGYIDAVKAKEIGRILEVDAILVGNYVVLNTTLEINLKALDVTNGLMIASSNRELPINDESASLLGVKVSSSANNTNKGFNNMPLNSNENYNNPETVNKECEQKKTGDFCFTNSSNFDLYVYITYDLFDKYVSNPSDKMTLTPGQTQCFYNLKTKPYLYYIYDKTLKNYRNERGQILVEKCKSKTFLIK